MIEKVCPKCAEVELERDVLQAINLWNAMKKYSELREEIIQILKTYNVEI